jgi:hypothetical protein
MAENRMKKIPAPPAAGRHLARRLRSFDEATERQREREQGGSASGSDRGWIREELYERKPAG